ncbi:MAG: glutamate 5-kinase [Gammaproteobacteria bacterium]|nr:glutamate 5-kinase [Gammaproteobacteria bacterium]
MNNRERLQKANRWVIKIGSALLTNEGRGLDNAAISQWVEQIVQLHKSGKQIVLVSSGAVAEGMKRFGWTTRPRALYQLQAAAAVGQMGLIQAYESCFNKHSIHTAQVLLTHDDLSNRTRYLNARSTLRELIKLGAVPVVNENDTVVTEEIQFGDNDTLAALVANLIEADVLLILTDQDGMHDSNPRTNPDSQLLNEVQANDAKLESMAGDSGSLGRGGMLTKVRAAKLAARSGAMTVIASGREDNVISRVASAEQVGTLFVTQQESLVARKQWLAGHMHTQGRLVLDEGAINVLTRSGKSLLSVGVSAVEGNFERGEVVVCVNEQGQEIARGLVNYNAQETRKIMRQPSDKIESILGYVDEPELIHRDNLVLL